MKTNELKKKVVAMYRVSTDRQDLARQENNIHRALQIDGYDLKNDVIEIGNKESGVLLDIAEREGLQELMRYVEQGIVECVYVDEISRLSRKAADTFIMRDYLLSHRVQLMCLHPSLKCFTDDFKIDPTANLVFSIMASMAENEGYIRKERFKTGKEKKIAEGKFVGGHVVRGYKINADKFVEIDEEDAKLIRRIFHLYTVEKMSSFEIGKMLYNEGVLPKRKSVRTCATFVIDTLRNRKYIGDGIYPQLIDTEVYDQARQQMSEFTFKPRHSYAGNVYLAQKLLNYKGRHLIAKKNDGSYVASTAVEKEDRISVNINMVDSLMVYEADRLSKYTAKNSDDVINDYTERIAIANREIQRAKERLAEIQKNIDDMFEKALIYGVSENKLQRMKAKADTERGELNRLIEDRQNTIYTLERRITEIERGEDVNSIYGMSDEEKKTAILKHIKEVEVSKVKRSIYDLNVIGHNGSETLYRVHTHKHIVEYKDEYFGWCKLDIEIERKYRRV